MRLLLLLFCAVLPSACPAAETPPAGRSVILVVIDCLRADHLSLYGYGRPTSPNIDAFAGDAAVFRQAVSQAPTTLLSFASIFTSLEVSAHGVRDQSFALGTSMLTLPEIFGIYNYKTAAFVGGPNLDPVFGLDRGFGKYFYVGRLDASFRDTLPAALAWAEERKAKGEKFLLVAHGNDLHTPYVFPASGLFGKGYRVSAQFKALPASEAKLFLLRGRRLKLESGRGYLELSKGDEGHLVARYDEGIRYADGLLGDFFGKLRAAGILDDAVVVIAADHGEGLFDHDYYFHEFNIYDDTLHVPLIIKAPGAGHREITGQVRLIDLLPTMLDFAGIPPLPSAQGVSLRPLVTGEGKFPEEAYAFSESAVGSAAVRSDRWKLIKTPKGVKLYDLAADPGETRDLAGREKAKAAELEKVLEDRLAYDAKLSSGGKPAGTGKSAAARKLDAAWQRAAYKGAR
jgi:arylsulfatase A-like enzyme